MWLTLEGETGATTRLGVTSEHPMFVAGLGWTAAGEVAPRDTIRNADLAELRVLAVAQDLLPNRVHNLEIAEAHTHFAGELEAWGHNADFDWVTGRVTKYPERRNRGCKLQPRGKDGRWKSYDDQVVYTESVPDVATGVAAGLDPSGSISPQNSGGTMYSNRRKFPVETVWRMRWDIGAFSS